MSDVRCVKPGAFAVGDVIERRGIRREITEVRDTGYTWRYPDIPDRDFWSENSTDPFFDLGWVKVR